jgi:phage tail sheath gpL-like
MAISNAVGSERISRVVGYKITKGNFSNSTPNLPQRIAILGEANTANQGALDTSAKEITTAQQAGELYGYGSPIYNMLRILRPVTGGGIGGIPTIVYAQASVGTAAEREVTPVGTATANGTHTLIINGRGSVDGQKYDFIVASGDTPAAIVTKMITAVNNVLGAPVIGTDGTGKIVLTSKWTGLTSEELDVVVDTNGASLGVVYGVVSSAVGAGSPSITSSLTSFGEDWNTIVLNPYGSVAFDDLEAYNGIPDPANPTGRYKGIIMKPFIALYGDLTDDPSVLTDGRKLEVTNASCPAPLSKGFSMEAAANMANLFARVAQDTTHLDVNAMTYTDMPTPSDDNIGSMVSYDFRDSIVKKGSSTVTLSSGRYKIEDFITTYHPDGELPPQFRYCRNLMLDFNVRFSYYLLEQINVVDKTIAADEDIIKVSGVIKPKMWKQIVDNMAADLGKRALVADVAFMQESIDVGISTVNPDRLETFFKYKRTGIARIASTTAEAGFNFGTL